MPEDFSLINQSKVSVPRLPLLDMKNAILGKKYTLSVAYVNTATSKKLNKKYRNKNKPTNVLSFPLSKKEGELVLCPVVIKKEMKNFEMNFKQFTGFLVIHGMLHLKGMLHSSRMERAEKKYQKKYEKYFYWNRRGHHEHQSGSGRIHQGRRKS